jgi:hypothetical protein
VGEVFGSGAVFAGLTLKTAPRLGHRPESDSNFGIFLVSLPSKVSPKVKIVRLTPLDPHCTAPALFLGQVCNDGCPS